MKVIVMPRAQRRARAVSAWWQEHRDASTLFDEEMAAAMSLLARDPHAGRRVLTQGGRVAYRLLLPRSAQHVYYVIDEEGVLVLAIWGARRARGPTL